MKITKETDYAIRALSFLAEHQGKPVDAKIIAKTQQIPESFAFKVLRKLIAKNIVISVRGVHGGYQLNKLPKEITLLDIVVAIEGEPTLNGCLENGAKCSLKQKNGYCKAHMELGRIQQVLKQELKRKSLEEILQ
ncbi:MAG: Rrf2 family transcriptional regulator [Cellulosilyticaceae bacterium]